MCFRNAKSRRDPSRGRIAPALALAAALSGCGGPHALPPPVTPYDYRDRHPVVLAEAPYVVDLFPRMRAGRLDQDTVGRLLGVAKRYARFGHGRISLLLPSGSGHAMSAEASAVRRALASMGAGDISIGTYPVVDANLAAPIRVSFQSLTAKVANRCGQWPRDLASGGSLEGWRNESYWNFGCATQSTLSAQVADPRDLSSPRGETPADIEMRMRAIGKLREGQDPSTIWNLQAAGISSVGK